MSEAIKNILDNTLFLAKTLDFFDGFKTPGKDYKIIACQASEELAEKYPDIYIDEIAQGKRTYTTSIRFLDIMQNSQEFKKNVNCKYIWTYQAYPWTNDLRYSGKTIFCIDYYLYLKLQNKLSQKKLLIEHSALLDEGVHKLSSNLQNTSMLLKTKVFPKQKIEYDVLRKEYKNTFVVCASNSNGGEGVFKISTKSEYVDALKSIDTPVIRTEKYLENGIPLNQIGFILNNGTIIKYKPSIQIIRDIHHANRMEYAGCDFSCDNYLKNSFEKLTNITELTHSIGKILFIMGYRGTFGCDYLIADEGIHFIELNPRYQASTLIPNLHLGNHQWQAPHVLHILGFTSIPIEYSTEIRRYAENSIYIDFIQNKKPVGFLNIYDEKIDKIKKPCKSIKIDEGISKGYVLFNNSIISNPNYPAEIDLTEFKILNF
ncbi:MAG: ATP-grasp domain-containing protein [Bacteroidales bacterium]|nr:ATP-grasp domain-containing protein [Bacteroidales bacterium]